MEKVLLKRNPIFEAGFIGLGGVGGPVCPLERTLERERIRELEREPCADPSLGRLLNHPCLQSHSAAALCD